jgi:hypothetical protein
LSSSVNPASQTTLWLEKKAPPPVDSISKTTSITLTEPPGSTVIVNELSLQRWTLLRVPNVTDWAKADDNANTSIKEVSNKEYTVLLCIIRMLL